MSLVDILRTRAERHPEKLAISFLKDGDGEEVSLRVAELDLRARAIAAALQDLGMSGERALLLYSPGLDFVTAFLGCLYAQAVAIPVAATGSSRPQARLRAIALDSQPALVLSTAAITARRAAISAHAPELRDLPWLATDEIGSELGSSWRDTTSGGKSLAFLQYTSGSTSMPKGVMVTHANLIHNEEVIRRVCGHSPDSVVVSWLPPYHDMGLIAGILQPLYTGALGVLMAPVAFLHRPRSWLEAISRHRADTSGGPNFGYELCVRKVSGEALAGLDLSSWRTAFNGSEPVRAETLQRFARAFAPCGFRPQALYPCYGLAEATLFVTGAERGSPPAVAEVAAAALDQNRWQAAAPDEPRRELVSCGRPWSGMEVTVVDPATGIPCPADEVGEIWISGPSVARGYWNRPEVTAQDFGARYLEAGGAERGPFLRTGDLGILRGADLFVTGRLKDLIILRGRNHYPQDIELTVERSHPALRPGCGAAFSVEVGGEERLVVAHEVERHPGASLESIAACVRQAVGEEHEVSVHEVVLLRTGVLPKTSSGKVQHRACRDAYLAKALAVVGRFAEVEAVAGASPADGLGRRRLLALDAEERLDALVALLRHEVAGAARVPESQLAVGQPLVRQGLDSLGAVELQQSLEEKLGILLPMGALLDSGSIEELARRLLSRLEDDVSAELRTEPAPPPTEYPLSDGQKALWFLYRLAPQSAAYNIAGAAQVRQELEIPALQRAWARLVARHPALRTTVHAADPEPIQRVHDRDEVDCVALAVFDAASWSATELAERLAAEAWRPFDLEIGPPLRLAIFSRSEADHDLVLAAHHIVADLWSMALMVAELGLLYGEETGGPPADLEPLTAAFADQVQWQRAFVAGAGGQRSWAYWRQRLAGTLPYLELPTDRPRPRLQSFDGAAEAVRLDRDLAERLAALARCRDTTMFMLLLAAFQVLLHRHTGQEDLLVASAAAGRRSRALGKVVGYFVNPLALRAEVTGGLPFEAFLDCVRRTVLEAFEHQDFPFLRLAERLQPERDPGRSPLCQAQFTLQRAPESSGQAIGAFAVGAAGARLASGGLVLESLPLAARGSQLDVSLEVAELAEGLALSLRYDSALFDSASMLRLLHQLRALLGGIEAVPDRQVGELSLLTPGEELQLVGAPAKRYPVMGPLHRLFEEQVRQRATSAAVVCEGAWLSYGELNARANRLGLRLASLGVGPDVLVGLYLDRSLDLVVAILGVLKAGGAYVPLELSNPRQRLEFQLADSRARLLVTRRDLAASLAGLDLPRVYMDGDLDPGEAGLTAAASPANLSASSEPENLAYVIYTSGSTGRPKGVGVTHANVARLFDSTQEHFAFDATEVWTLFHSYAFDFSVWELWGALLYGGRLVVVPYWVSRSPESFHELLAVQRVTVLSQTPSAFRPLMGVEEELRCPGDLALRWLVFGGEALEFASLRPWIRRHGEDAPRVINMYGITETTVFVTFRRVLGREVLEGAESEIGAPLADLEAHVLDRTQRLAPWGAIGELCIGGPGLARGYQSRPDLTAERFVPDPFSGRLGDRLYRSGDLARRLPAGDLEYLGRIDHQVKIRGFRIELGEIDSALRAHPALRDVAVVAREDRSGALRLVAYIVCGDACPSVEELRRFLATSLPEHMVPSFFVALESLPLTSNGKVDRRALPSPEESAVGREGTYVAPRTPQEEILAGIWRSLLAVERVGVEDDFFALGGHSLLATRVISRVREALGVELPLSAVFEARTLGELAQRLEESVVLPLAPPRLQQTSLPTLRRMPRSGEVPLSYSQERLWFLDQLEPGSPAYNMAATVRLDGDLDVSALAGSLSEVVRRHEALRTTFRAGSAGPRQHIAPPAPMVLGLVDLDDLPAVRQGLEADRLAATEARRPFDLAAGPLFRACLLRLAPREQVLIANLHHIVADGWSIEVLVRELSVLYGALHSGTAPALAELPVQYADFAEWQRQWLRDAVLEERLGYWREQLRGAPPELALPFDLPPRAEGDSRDSAAEDFLLVRPLVAALQGLGERLGCTLFMVLVAGFQALLQRCCGEDDVVVGTPVANRLRREVEELIGFFVNTLVLRTSLAGRPTSVALLQRVRDVALGAYTHQDLPFERLVEALNPERALGRDPLFQVMVSLERNAPAGRGSGTLALRPVAIETGIARWVLTLELAEGDEGISGRLRFRTGRFHPSTVARLAGHLRSLLEGMAAEPERPVVELPLLDAAERHQLLTEWNGALQEDDSATSVPELFAAQVEKTPLAVGLAFAGSELTYGELGARVDRLAYRLRRLGAGPGARVALCLERSPGVVTSVLGVLASGAAFVPLDPTHPVERLAYLIKDSGATILVTREAIARRLPAHGAVTLFVDDAADPPSPEIAAAAGSRAAPGDPAYLIYTSGTTGRPKAVLVTHGSLAHTLAASRQIHGWTAEDRMPCLSPSSFDIFLFEVLGPLLAGGTCLLFPHDPTLDPRAVAAALPGLTRLHAVPAVMRELIREVRALGLDGAGCSRLRTVFVGGDAVSPDLLVEMRQTFPSADIRILYGPTEATIFCSSHVVAASGERRQLLGRPLPGVALRVLDRGGEPAAIGVAGELCIAGPGLAQGYVGRPLLTAERWVPDGYHGPAGARLYRTGDLARWLPEGILEFLGRLDQQLKIRGFRVEPGEVETALLAYPEMREVAVVGRAGSDGEHRLVAYVVASREAPPATGELRDFLLGRLPEYLVPSVYVALKILPRTASGKVDRRTLPSPEESAAGAEGAYVAPRTPQEEILAGIWRSLLQMERIGVEDDFFALGGHSLLATRLISRVRDALGVELPLAAVFEARTVGELARRLAASVAGQPMPPLRRMPRSEEVPLSYAQERLWFLDQLEPGSPAYNMAATVRLDGDLDVSALAGGLCEVVRRHEALRTTFRAGSAGPRQHLEPPAPMALPVVDLAGLPAARRALEADRLARAAARRPFDLALGPLFRACLLCLAARERVLVANLHHIVADGWSIEVLVRELAVLYGALRSGTASALAELPVQYADFVQWQRWWLSGEVLEERLGYWRERLRGAPSELALPFDLPPCAERDPRGAAQDWALAQPSVAALRGLGERLGCTLFMVLAAGFQALLQRYSGEDDVVVGTPVANRTRRELEDLIGFFVNTLVLRTSLAGEPTTVELLQRVREGALGAYTHQDLPFERLVEALNPERVLGRDPLFQVMVSLQQTLPAGGEAGGLSLRPVAIETGICRWMLDLEMTEDDAGIVGRLRYQAERFHASTVARMTGHLRSLLLGMVAEPERPVAELLLLSPAERFQALAEWGEGAPRVAGPLVHEAVESWSESMPGSPAVLTMASASGGLGAAPDLTYGDLERRANQLAHHLVALGVVRETVVAILLERSPEAIVALLGVLKAGGACLPLDPAHPARRLRHLLADSGAALLVTRGSLLGRLGPRPEAGESESLPWIVDLATAAAAIAQGPPGRPEHRALPGQLAYLLYTSGSTGSPKGVGLAHRSLAAYLAAMGERWEVRPGDRVLQFASLGFDISVEEIFLTLGRGASLVLRDTEMLVSTERFLRVAGRCGITAMSLPTAFWHQVAADLGTAGVTLPASLRLLVLGGERALADRLAIWQRHGGARVRVLNTYGPTECTVVATACEVTGQTPAEIPIGRPIAGMVCRVLSAALDPVPAGVEAELYLGGCGLARGYVGRPELTAERFVPDPFSSLPGERLYRTGDRVRFLPDGTLQFRGRADRQVKIRGFRVEPGEIEAALGAHPAVRDVVVMTGEDRAGTVRLLAYVVPFAEVPAPTAAELRGFLVTRLPEAMVPAAFVLLEEIPLTLNGKVDRCALPLPEERAAETGGMYVAPRTPHEEILAGIWRSLLAVERIGVGDDFFALGGHSLLATRVISRLRDALGVELPLAAVFEARTVGELARRLEEAAAGGPAAPMPPVRRMPRSGGMSLSYAQERLWFLDRLEPGSPAYNMAATVCLDGDLDVPALAGSLSEVVRRHEALRTTFRAGPAGPRQHVAPPAPMGLPRVDLVDLPAARRQVEADRLAAVEARRPFDLAVGPLFRACLLHLAPRQEVLIANLHHVVADGWSIEVLVRELAALYGALHAGTPPALLELPVQYADFAEWQRQWLRGEVLEERLGYWRERLRGAPSELALPFDLPPCAERDPRGAAQGFVLTRAWVTALRNLGERLGCTLFMVLVAGFQALLQRCCGEDDVVVGTPVANRTRSELEELIGFFVNTLVLRTSLADRPTSVALLRRVRDVALGAYTHQDLPFERLVEALNPDRALGRDPLFQVMVSLERSASTSHQAGTLALRPVAIETGIARWVLTLELAEGDEGISGRLRFQTGRFHASTVARMAGHLVSLLQGMAAEPERPVAELSLLAAAERQQLLAEWSGARWEGDAGISVPERFRAQAERTPSAVGLSFAGSELTYRDLGAQAGRLERRLRRLGAGPGARVAVCLERSPGMVTAILGVLAAGAAFVPLDPTHPAERLAYLLADSGATILVTREAIARRLPVHGAVALLVDAEVDFPSAEREARIGCRAELGDPAYLIYTSGTTGPPKAVVVTHGSLAHTLAASRQIHGWTAADRMPCLSPSSFDIFLFEVLAPLLVGGTCVLFGHDPTLDPRSVVAALPGLTRLHAVPAVMRELIREMRARGVDGVGCRRLRTVFVGGDAVPPDLLDEMREVFPAAEIRILYGPTEATIFCASHTVAADGDRRQRLGRPLPGVSLRVLDRGGEPAAIGIAGELCIAGPGLGQGYVGRPELTAGRWVPDEYGEPEGGRLYRTGDLARWLPDGSLEFLGRLDQQVKIRGMRVEPGEVEAALLAYPEMREAIVVGQAGRDGEHRLVAYLVVSGEAPPATGELREFLLQRLPEHLVPSAFVALRGLPRTASGKVDRRALPSPEEAAVGTEGAAMAPRTPQEEILAGIWSEVLGRESVGVNEDFFALGGHSLLATRVTSGIDAAFGTEIPLSWLFESPTIAQLAVRIEQSAHLAAGVVRPPLTRSLHGLPPPLSFAQQRLWFLDRLAPGSSYNIPAAVRFQGRLDAAALATSLSEVVRRHEVLRTTFALAGGAPVQVISPPTGLFLPQIDLRRLARDQAGRERSCLQVAEARRAFDLERGPVFRAVLIRLDEEDAVLVLTLHHIAADGWSMGVLVREMTELYRAQSMAKPSALPELPVQYADFACWQRSWLQGEILEAQLAYWRRQLAGSPPELPLPVDRRRRRRPALRAAGRSALLSSDLAAGLGALARQEGATLFMVLLAAFQTLLYRCSGQHDVIVGTPIAGRTQRAIEGLIGFFANTLVLRSNLEGNPTFRGLLGRVRRMTLDAFAHQDLPFERLVEAVQPERSEDRSPFFRVLFALQNTALPTPELPGLLISVEELETGTAKADLAFALREVAEGLWAEMEYDAELFDAETIESLLGQYATLLRSVVIDPEVRISNVSLAAPAAPAASVRTSAAHRHRPPPVTVETPVKGI